MKIEEGKYYKNREGREVGPMVRGRDITYLWRDHCGMCYTSDGYYYHCEASPRDLIEEWRDPIDVYTIPTMPFGLLTPEQQQSLRDHDGVIEHFGIGGWLVASPRFFDVLSYRAKPKPALVPDVVPWDAIAPEYVKYSRRQNDQCWLETGDHVIARIDGLLSGHSIGNMPAADATQYRPGYKP